MVAGCGFKGIGCMPYPNGNSGGRSVGRSAIISGNIGRVISRGIRKCQEGGGLVSLSGLYRPGEVMDGAG
jgi:hypothetical protein